MRDNLAVDSNILVYAVDRAAGDKRQKAKEVINKARARDAAVPIQCVAETHYQALRKGSVSERFRKFLKGIVRGKDFRNPAYTQSEFLKAMESESDFWDRLIEITVLENGYEVIYTENTQDFDELEAVNPFGTSTD